MALADTAELAVRLTLDDRFSRSIRGASSSLGRFEGSVRRTGKGIGQLGAGLGRAGLVIGTAVVAGVAATAKAAIDFEDAFAGVRKTVQASDAELDAIAKSFRTMATEIPVAATELARIGEVAGALGIKTKDIDDFTKTVALLSQTTNLTSDAAAEALGKVGTILGLTGKDFETFADTLVNLGNQGASTEAEIIEVTKRFAAMGKQAGLTTDQILALSSAATSLGAEPEAAGSALSRIFANMSTDIALANSKGKAFAKITGDSLKVLTRKINKGDALAVLLDFLKGLQGLSRTGAAKALKAAGITNVRDRDAILKMAQNLEFVNDQLDIAENSTGALGKEAAKRFNTIASKVKLFGQNINEAAITIGEGMLPAIGRATDKLIAFLKLPGTRTELTKLGEDIGAAIDGIDWNAVLSGARDFVGVMKGALTVSLEILKVINALPTQIKALGLGAILLNKASGGLVGAGVGNIVGGLGESIARALGSKLPGGLGKLFVQPVFVTNFPAGFGGFGGGGGKGGIPPIATGVGTGALASLGLIAAPIALAIGEKLSVDAFGQALRDSGVPNDIKAAGVGIAAIPGQLANIGEVIRLFQTGVTPGGPAHGGMSPGERHERDVAAEAVRTLAAQEHARGERLVQSGAQTKASVDASKASLVAAEAETKRETTRGAMIIRSQTQSSAAVVAGATRAGSSAIVAAIFAARPVINVNNVTKYVTNQQRAGPGVGSSGQPAHDLI